MCGGSNGKSSAEEVEVIASSLVVGSVGLDYKIGAVCSLLSSFFPVLKDHPYMQNSSIRIESWVRGASLGISLCFFSLALSVSDTD